jgi:outer membrane protein TolC
MGTLRTARPTLRTWVLAPVVGAVLLCLVACLLAADEPAAPPPGAAPGSASPVQVFDLAECRRIALEKQPTLAAYRASLANAQARSQAVNDLLVPDALKPDLPIRRKQAAMAIRIAQANLDQAEWNFQADVTRLYLTAVYSREQQRVADEALADKDHPRSLYYLQDLAATIVKTNARPDVKEWNVQHIGVLVDVVRGRREEAVQGYERALAALREAMGAEPCCCFALVDERLPESPSVPDCEQVQALAAARRGELAQAIIAGDIVALEVQAQGASHHPQENTFAASSDIHANLIPPGVRDGEYRPAGLGIEMPTTLAGPRAGRIEQASALHARAVAVVDKVHNLVVLDARDAYLRWKEAAQQAERYEAAARQARRVADRVRTDFLPADKTGSRPNFDDLTNAALEATHLRVQANQARHQALLALSSLERATAGGFCPQFTPAGESKENNGQPGGNGPRP